MSGWLLFVGLGAGYLINKQLTLQQQLQETVNIDRSEDSSALVEIHNVQKKIPVSYTHLTLPTNREV